MRRRVQRLAFIQSQDNECIVCTEGPKEVVFIPCGHNICCRICVADMQQRAATEKNKDGSAKEFCCPKCMQPVLKSIVPSDD